MKVIVCGAGQVGFNIARHLSAQDNDVTVIDTSEVLIRQISERLDVKAFVGHASDPAMLDKAGATDTDLLVAVTQSDEVNMVACQVGYSLFNVTTKVARIRNQAYLRSRWGDLFSRGNMPIDVVISPELEVARALERRLAVPGAFDMIPFLDGRLHLIGLRLDANCPVLDTPLKQLTELFPNLNTSVVAIIRQDKVFIPRSTDQLRPGDSIYITVEKNRSDRAMSVFGHEENTARRLVIVGGGNIGFFLADRLEKNGSSLNVKIIEQNTAQANKIAEHLHKTVVINGDALNNDILEEANVRDADTLVAVADDDEVNILASLLAKRAGCARSIALLINPAYNTLVDTLGIDVVLDPRETTVSSIVRHIRRGRIRDLYSIREGAAEIIELDVIEGSEVAGKTLSQLRLSNSVRVGAIERSGKLLPPAGDSRFEIGDRVVLLTMSDAVRQIEQLFAARPDVF